MLDAALAPTSSELISEPIPTRYSGLGVRAFSWDKLKSNEFSFSLLKGNLCSQGIGSVARDSMLKTQ